MIKIVRSNCPQQLIDNKVNWDHKVANGTAKSHCIPSPSETKETLGNDANRKCMYCEGLANLYEIEHIKPFQKYKTLAHEWTNLGWACGPCNKKKSDTEGFVDPYTSDPRALIKFERHNAVAIDEANDEVALTIDRLLNFEGVFQRRLLAIGSFIDAYELMDEGSRKIYSKKYRDSTKTYSAMFEDYLDSIGA